MRAQGKTPIIFIHGAFCGAWSFDLFRRPFDKRGYRTLTPDLPHHEQGADVDALCQLGVREYAAAIEAVCSRLDQPPVLIGHSMGGLIAQIVASHRPVAGLILLAPASPWGVWPTTTEETAASLALYTMGDFWRRPVEPDYAAARQFALQNFTRDEALRLFARMVPESGRAAFESIHWWRDASMRSAAPVYLIEAPVLAIAGGRDRLTPAPTIRRLAQRFPSDQATFVELPDMSHWLPAEPGWARVAELCLDWLADKGVTASPGGGLSRAMRAAISAAGPTPVR